MLMQTLLLVACAGQSGAPGQVPPRPEVKMEIAPSVTTIAPGRAFDMLCTLHVPEGWHIYWKDPGSSGAPTDVDVLSDDGWTTGPTRYPAPGQITEQRGVVNVHEGKVTFAVGVIAPDDLVPGTVISLGVHADWFVCRTVCYIGGSTRTVTLAVTASPGAPTPEAAALRQLPQPIGRRPGATVRREGDRVIIDVADPAHQPVRFIPESVPGVEVGPVTVRTTPIGVSVEIQVVLEPENSLGQPPALRGLLMEGPGRYDPAWEIDLPLSKARDAAQAAPGATKED